MKKKVIIAVAIVLVLLAGLLVYQKVIVPKNRYSEAERLLGEGRYEEAIDAFSALGDYSDAASRSLDAKRQQGEALLNGADFDAAYAVFGELGDTARQADVRMAQGDALLAAVFNLCFDPMETVRIRAAAKPGGVELLGSDGRWSPVPHSFAGNELTVETALPCYGEAILRIRG